MKKLLTFAAATTAAISLGACAMHSSPTDLPPGQYAHTTHSTDANGTAHDTTTDTSVYYDANGNKKATTDTTSATDPKGLFNKSTTTTTTTETQ